MATRFTAIVFGAVVILGLTPDVPVVAQLTSKQGDCLLQMNKQLYKVDRVQGRIIRRCIGYFAKGRPLAPDPAVDTLEECVLTDHKGDLATESGKTTAKFNSACTGIDSNQQPKLPPFGVTDDAVVVGAGVQKQLDLAHDIFGLDLDAPGTIATIFDTDEVLEAIKCQQKVLQAVLKCESTKLKSFVKCKKGAGAAGVSSAAELETLCTMQDGDPTTGIPDPRGKIAKACSDPERGIARELQRRCALSIRSLSELFAGCATDDPAELAACLDRNVECRVCRAINTADALSRDCDLFDNGFNDDTCS